MYIISNSFMKSIRTFTLISIIITSYYFVYYFYIGITNPIPALGDSWDYHIPISKAILNGTFLRPEYFNNAKMYFPGSSEAINSIFIFFRIPLTISNIFATLVLFLCCWKLALVFRLQRDYALLYSLTFITLTAVMRWMNAVSIDVWMGVFFTLAIILLENPKKSLIYFLKLGFVLGMIIGSKYTGILFLSTLIVFYLKKIFTFINLSRFVAFCIPFSIFGLFWYIRNYIFIHNPFYPISIFGFKGENIFGNYTMWNVFISHPIEMFNSAFGEYKFWLFSIIIAVAVIAHQFFIKKLFKIDSTIRMFILGTVNFIMFLTFATSEQTWIMVSSFRYSYPTFIPLILGVFLLAAKYKKQAIIGYVSIAGMINVLTMGYYPKLLLAYLPISLLFFYFYLKRSR